MELRFEIAEASNSLGKKGYIVTTDKDRIIFFENEIEAKKYMKEQIDLLEFIFKL